MLGRFVACQRPEIWFSFLWNIPACQAEIWLTILFFFQPDGGGEHRTKRYRRDRIGGRAQGCRGQYRRARIPYWKTHHTYGDRPHRIQTPRRGTYSSHLLWY